MEAAHTAPFLANDKSISSVVAPSGITSKDGYVVREFGGEPFANQA